MENNDKSTTLPIDSIIEEELHMERGLNYCQISSEVMDMTIQDIRNPSNNKDMYKDKNGNDIITDVGSDKDQEHSGKPDTLFTIREYSKRDLTIGDQPLIKNNTIEELKLKLEQKELLFKPRPNTPSWPASPTTPKSSPVEEPEEMIPETRTPSLLTDDGLIAPRKPVNPVREDPGRQNLHRELLFNQKIGKNVLNQKSELQKALEKHKDNIAKKQLEHHISDKTPELEKVIADRARRLEKPVKPENEEDKVINKEFLQARMKLKSTSESK